MKMRILSFVFIASGVNFVFCQNNTKTNESVKDSVVVVPTVGYRVTQGETIIMISRKYRVSPREIYDLNPDAVNGISQNMVLMLPEDKVRAVNERRKPKQDGAYAASQD